MTDAIFLNASFDKFLCSSGINQSNILSGSILIIYKHDHFYQTYGAKAAIYLRPPQNHALSVFIDEELLLISPYGIAGISYNAENP